MNKVDLINHIKVMEKNLATLTTDLLTLRSLVEVMVDDNATIPRPINIPMEPPPPSITVDTLKVALPISKPKPYIDSLNLFNQKVNYVLNEVIYLANGESLLSVTDKDGKSATIPITANTISSYSVFNLFNASVNVVKNMFIDMNPTVYLGFKNSNLVVVDFGKYGFLADDKIRLRGILDITKYNTVTPFSIKNHDDPVKARLLHTGFSNSLIEEIYVKEKSIVMHLTQEGRAATLEVPSRTLNKMLKQYTSTKSVSPKEILELKRVHPDFRIIQYKLLGGDNSSIFSTVTSNYPLLGKKHLARIIQNWAMVYPELINIIEVKYIDI